MDAFHSGKDRVAIIGLGKVGTAVGSLLQKAGYPIVAVADRSETVLRENIRYTGGRPFSQPADAATLADCILITVPDDLIVTACEEISLAGAVGPGTKVIHMSGAGGLDILGAAKARGAFIASIHPIQSFADVEGAIESIPGSTFGITAMEEIRTWSVAFVKDLGGVPFFVPENEKPLYHAAACIASNYLTTLIHMVEEIYQRFGLDRAEAINAFWPLIKGTLKNIETKGTVQALTGPIARGDAGTVGKHVLALNEKLPHLIDVYRLMGAMTVDLALKKKSLSTEQAQKILKILSGGSRDEHTGQDQ